MDNQLIAEYEETQHRLHVALHRYRLGMCGKSDVLNAAKHYQSAVKAVTSAFNKRKHPEPISLWVEAVLELSDEYRRTLAQMGYTGKASFSPVGKGQKIVKVEK